VGAVFLLHLLLDPTCSALQSDSALPAESPSANQEEADSTKPDRASEPSNVIRLTSDEFGHPVALETATKKFVLKNDKGEIELEVFLESVIHVADASYYRGFQQRFERYDSVLYELVADQSERQATDNDLPSGFQLFQQISTGTLGLEYQLGAIDYSAENMIHADLGDQFGEISAARFGLPAKHSPIAD
jgi:hypothetical protein